jgi:hypothetical protein
MTFTQEDKRDKIRSQLLFEIANPEPPKAHAAKSPGGLSKKAKFLGNPRKVKQPGEKPF